MTARRGPGTHEDAPSPQRRAFRSGTLLIIGFGIFLLVGWIFYRQTLPPAWLYDFSEAVAQHASPDRSPPEPEDIRQVAPPIEVEDPYICLANVIDLSWDHIFVVAPGQDLRVHPVLSQSVWPDQPLSYYVDLMARDERYQLVVLVNANAVVDAQLYFTFWGDLSPISRPEGYTRGEAIFTAASLNGLYIVSPVLDPPVDTCS